MSVSVKKDTLDRLHKKCHRGEKHDNLINRLLDACLDDEEHINMSEETEKRLLVYTGCGDVDEALNILLDKYGAIVK